MVNPDAEYFDEINFNQIHNYGNFYNHLHGCRKLVESLACIIIIYEWCTQPCACHI